MTATMNLTDSDKIEKKLEEMNEKLASISAREVLFIIVLTFVILFALLNLCLALCERRRKKQNNSVPQSIVIQPNNSKSSKRNDRSSRHEISSGYDQDVLPSKSMKMKLSISPSASKTKKRRSKDSTSEESQVPTKSEHSHKSDTSTKKHDETSVEPSTAPHSGSTHPPAPLPPASQLVHSAPPPNAAPSATSSATPSAPPAAAPVVSLTAPVAPSAPPKTSESSDSMASFTVPEESGASKTKNSTSASSASKDSLATTPTATTLSGSSVLSAPPEAVQKPSERADDVTTAKDITQPKSATSPAAPPVVLSTPVLLEKKASEKKNLPVRFSSDTAPIGGGPSPPPPPPPPEKDYRFSGPSKPTMKPDDRLRNRYEACRSGMQELDALRAKHTLLIQNLRSRLPVIPGSLDDVQTREKKTRDVFLDRFSLQSVDSGVSSQNTLSSTRSSTPEDFKSSRHSNIYENSSSTMNYSTFRKLSLESTHSVSHVMPEKTSAPFAPPVITSRSCHRGAWKTSPQRIRPKSMFDTTTSTTEYLFEKPPRPPIDLSKDVSSVPPPILGNVPILQRRSAFTVINQSSKRHSSIEPSFQHHLPSSLSQLSINEEYKTPLKAEVVRRNKEKADAMFRANVVYVSPSEQQRAAPVRFSPARSPPVRRALPIEVKQSQHYAQPCKIRSPKLNSKTVFAAKPISVRPSTSPKITQRSTWLQSQPL